MQHSGIIAFALLKLVRLRLGGARCPLSWINPNKNYTPTDGVCGEKRAFLSLVFKKRKASNFSLTRMYILRVCALVFITETKKIFLHWIIHWFLKNMWQPIIIKKCEINNRSWSLTVCFFVIVEHLLRGVRRAFLNQLFNCYW